jgi:Uma2 family endonuclease
MNAPVPPSAFARERFTVAQIMRLVELGLISEDADFELIDGEITPMTPKGPLHEDVRNALGRWIRKLPVDIDFLAETTLWLSDDTFVEPDFVLFPASVPIKDLKPSDVLLAIEVADSSLAYDLTVKVPRYAAAGIQEYWVINAAYRTTRVFRGPGPQGWAEVFDVAAGEKVAALCAPEFGVAV